MGALKENRWLIVSLILLPILVLAFVLIFILQGENQSSEKSAANKEERITTVENFDNFSDIPDPSVTVDNGSDGQLTENSAPPVVTSDSTNEEEIEVVTETSEPQETTPEPTPTAPESPVIIAKPRKTSNKSSVRFLLQGSNIYCSLNGDEAKRCAEKVVYKNLKTGTYRFSAWQQNNAGKSKTVTYSFTIDRKAPRPVRITKAPAALSNKNSATFAFRGEKGATYHCKLSGRGSKSCSSPITYRGLGDGKYYFFVWQKDQAGNGSKSKSVSFQVDTTAPPLPAIESSELIGNTLTVFFRDDGYSLFCSLDGAASVACPLEAVFADLAPGEHTLAFYQKDRVGNSSSLATYSFTVDLLTAKRSRLLRSSGTGASESEVSATSVSVASAIQMSMSETSNFSDVVSETELRSLNPLDNSDASAVSFSGDLSLRSNATWEVEVSLTNLTNPERATDVVMSPIGDSGNPNTDNAYQAAQVAGSGNISWSTNAGTYLGTAEIVASNGY